MVCLHLGVVGRGDDHIKRRRVTLCRARDKSSAMATAPTHLIQSDMFLQQPGSRRTTTC